MVDEGGGVSCDDTAGDGGLFVISIELIFKYRLSVPRLLVTSSARVGGL